MADIFDDGKTDAPDPKGGDNSQRAAADELHRFAIRIERLEQEKAELSGDIKDIFGEAKARGYDTKALKAVLSLRKKDESLRTTIHLYATTMGVFG